MLAGLCGGRVPSCGDPEAGGHDACCECCAVSLEESTVLRVKNCVCLLACSEGVFLPVQVQKQAVMMRAVSAVLCW